MKPILFPKTASNFTSNGLGRLDCISCLVTEERNGIFELEAEITEAAYHASEIEAESFIVAKVPDRSALQAFRVYNIVKNINGHYHIYANHVSYQLAYITTMPFTVALAQNACATTLAALKSNAVGDCPFTFSTDVTTASSFKLAALCSIRKALGGMQGSVLDQFGGEFKWDNDTVYLYKNRGVTTPSVTLRYGKNIIDLQQEENIADTITGIVPFWTDSEGGDIVTLTEKVVEISTASSFPYKKTIPYDFSQKFETKPTEAQLRTAAQAYVNANKVGVPKVSIKLSFVELADTEEYKDIYPLQSVNLCDNITVQFEKLGIDTTAEIVKVVYDVLSERYNSIEIGDLRSTLYSTISGNIQDIDGMQSVTQEMIKTNNVGIQGDISGAITTAETYANGVGASTLSSAKTYADGVGNAAKGYTDSKISQLDYVTPNQLSTAVSNATAWLTGSDGYVIAVKDSNGNWKELLFADHNDPAQWHNVLRINENGIGFSSNGGQTYTQAWTLDGRLVIGGTNVPSLTVYDSNNTAIFQISASGMQWISTSSQMSLNGVLTADSAILTNVTITGGTLTIKNSSNQTIFSIGPNGLYWNLAKSSMTTNGELTAQDATLSGSFECGTNNGSKISISGGQIDFLYNSANVSNLKADYYSGHNYFYMTSPGTIQIIGSYDPDDGRKCYAEFGGYSSGGLLYDINFGCDYFGVEGSQVELKASTNSGLSKIDIQYNSIEMDAYGDIDILVNHSYSAINLSTDTHCAIIIGDKDYDDNNIKIDAGSQLEIITNQLKINGDTGYTGWVNIPNGDSLYFEKGILVNVM